MNNQSLFGNTQKNPNPRNPKGPSVGIVIAKRAVTTRTTSTLNSAHNNKSAMTVPHPQGDVPKVIVAEEASEIAEAPDIESDTAPSQRTLQLWNEVAHGIDKNSTGESTIAFENIRD